MTTNEDRYTEIKTKYPKIFDGPCELSVGEGWLQIVDTACGLIQGYIDGRIESRAYAMKRNLIRAQALAGDWTMFNEDVGRLDNHKWVESQRDWLLNKSVEMEVPDLVTQLTARQVKEKFGEMRFYVEGGDQFTQGVVDMAESMTSHTCDVCSAPGTRGGSGWIRTRCDLHKEPDRV